MAKATAYNPKSTKPSKPNEDIKVDTGTIRAGSPLNYVREKNKQRLSSKKESSNHGSGKNSIIAVHPIEPLSPSGA